VVTHRMGVLAGLHLLRACQLLGVGVDERDSHRSFVGFVEV
jgi:hypothetical protein